jgi:hypothetical protein
MVKHLKFYASMHCMKSKIWFDVTFCMDEEIYNRLGQGMWIPKHRWSLSDPWHETRTENVL